MKSVFESMGGTYTKSGDYYIPDITLPEESNRKIGKYGRMRHRYLKEHGMWVHCRQKPPYPSAWCFAVLPSSGHSPDNRKTYLSHRRPSP